MTIEWGGLPFISNATVQVLDPLGQAPTSVIDSDHQFKVRVTWNVPDPLDDYLGGQFRLRAYAESMGPGPETQIGTDKFEPVVQFKENYVHEIDVNPPALLGEGVLDPVSGQRVSGTYRILAVIQHLNPGPTRCSGFTDEKVVQIRTP